MFQKQREFDSALFYFNKSLIMFKNIQRKPDIANVYNNISTSLSYLNKNNEALKYMDTSLVVWATHVKLDVLLANCQTLLKVSDSCPTLRG